MEDGLRRRGWFYVTPPPSPTSAGRPPLGNPPSYSFNAVCNCRSYQSVYLSLLLLDVLLLFDRKTHLDSLLKVEKNQHR